MIEIQKHNGQYCITKGDSTFVPDVIRITETTINLYTYVYNFIKNTEELIFMGWIRSSDDEEIKILYGC